MPVSWRENGHVTEVVILMESHVREVVSLMEGAWSCYRGGQYNGGRILVTEVASL